MDMWLKAGRKKMNQIHAVEEGFRREVPAFNIGDTIRIYVKVVEGDKERLQPFEGVVIARKGSGVRETFMVRKMSFGVGVERIFPVHSPSIDKKGKEAKIKEKSREAK